MKNYIVSEITHYCNIITNKCSEITPKKIDFYDLTFVLGGSMTYSANGKTYVLRKNDAIFLKPGTIRGRLSGNETVKYVSFNFHIFPQTVLPFDIYIPNCISSDIKKLLSAFPQSHISPYYHSSEKIANILNYILFEFLDMTSQTYKNEHVLKIIRYIGEHITEKMTLETISRQINLTKEYTSHIFKKETNKSLTDYINERKMFFAKELIQSHELSLVDVASTLGYENYTYFSRLFKKYFDVTPISLKNKA